MLSPISIRNPTRKRSFGHGLTPRQREVLQLVSEGRSTKEMAYTLKVSQKTIEFHRANLMDVLRLRTTAELTRYALEHGIAGAGFTVVGHINSSERLSLAKRRNQLRLARTDCWTLPTVFAGIDAPPDLVSAFVPEIHRYGPMVWAISQPDGNQFPAGFAEPISGKSRLLGGAYRKMAVCNSESGSWL